MTYGLGTAALSENVPAGSPEKMHRLHSSTISWRSLDPDHRLLLVDRALKPANDLADGFPVAL